MSRIYATGLGRATFKQVLHKGLGTARPSSIGIAVAYVSVAGIIRLKGNLDRAGVQNVRLVSDTKDAITHPNALQKAYSWGWQVKAVNSLLGTFHPKLYVGGDKFDEEKGFEAVSLSIVGSANLSRAAFEKNGECSYLRIGGGTNLDLSAGLAWKECWDTGVLQDANSIDVYAKYFALNNRRRSPFDLKVLGVEDSGNLQLAAVPSAAERALPTSAATTAWAGLQSFTGEYNLQLEFPRDAGAVLRRLLDTDERNRRATFICEDGREREFIFRFYPDNGMFRLNIHNDTPNAAWARENQDGIAVVQCDLDANYFRILKSGSRADSVVRRSAALGTWGKTATRSYGWY